LIPLKQRIFVQNANSGLQEIDTQLSNKFIEIKKDSISNSRIYQPISILINQSINFTIPFNDLNSLIGTSNNLLYLFDGKHLLPYPIDNQQYLRANTLASGIALNSNEFALSTLNGGCMIMDKNTGTTISTINYANGLPDDEIFCLAIDNNRGLWLAHEFGVSRANLSLTVKDYSSYKGLDGKATDIQVFNNTIYVSTTEGVYFLKQANRESSNYAKNSYSDNYVFKKVDGISAKCRHLLSCSENLLVSTTSEVYQISGNKARIIFNDKNINKIECSNDSNLVYVCSKQGLKVLHYDKERKFWIADSNKYKELTNNILTISEQNDSTLWLGSENAAYKVTSSKLTNNLSVKIFTFQKSSTLGDEVVVKSIAGILYFFLPSEVYIYDNQRDMMCKFNGFAVDNNSKEPYLFTDNSLVLILQNNEWHSFNKMISNEIETIPIINLFGEIQSVCVDSVNSLWLLSRENRIMKIFDSTVSDFKPNFNLEIDKIYNTDSSFSFAPQELNYDQRALKFHVTAPFFIKENSNQFQYQVVGLSNGWSPWSLSQTVEYQYFPYGKHSIQFRAKNCLGQVSDIKEFRFTIQPPFWRTGWFYTIILLTVIVLLNSIIYWRTHTLEKEKQRLESIIVERTQEISFKNKELEQHQNHLECLVDERTKDLLAAKIRAEESEKLKTSFLANMTHEIRTPLNAIVGFSKLISYPRTSEEKRRMYTDYISEGSESLLNLMDNILDFSELESSELELLNDDIDLFDIILELKRTFSEKIKRRNKINLELIPILPTQIEEYQLFTDPYRVKQIIGNLLNNSLKFTENGSIEFGFCEKQNAENQIYVEFFVKDTGIGIAPENYEIIFERFMKIEDSDADELYRGAGLGLTIAKKLVEILGGKIWLESTLGLGTTFYFTIPKTQ